jgi:hypothetical protein
MKMRVENTTDRCETAGRVREDILKNCKTINKREAENFIE